MARSRNIKPGFFQNEFMASKRPEVQLLFLGLLTIADREGRLEDRPVKIKGQIFPFQDLDVNAALEELATITDPFQDRPFIYRYEAGGRRYIQIVNFNKHQHIHPNEVASIIPPMPSVEPEEIRSTPDSIEPCHEPSAPKVIPARALPSLPSCTSFPSSPSLPSLVSKIPEGVRIPKEILEDEEWAASLGEWVDHLRERSGVVTKKALQLQLRDMVAHGRALSLQAIATAIKRGWREPDWKGSTTKQRATGEITVEEIFGSGHT